MKRSMIILLLLILHPTAFASTDIEEFQSRWAMANYAAKDEAQEKQFRTLVADIGNAVEEAPNNPELLIWKGIIESSFAGKTSGLEALRLVKSARASLETVLDINPDALSGSAYTSLGALYYQVPPWPIAFGSDKKARRFLEKSLQVNPDGIDSNYFYGEFLIEEKDYEGARSALNKALAAEDRPGRSLADEGRRREIKALLAKIQN